MSDIHNVLAELISTHIVRLGDHPKYIYLGQNEYKLLVKEAYTPFTDRSLSSRRSYNDIDVIIVDDDNHVGVSFE